MSGGEAGDARRPTFRLIQGLRGLAALWVVLFHLEKTRSIAALTAALPGWLDLALFRYGSAGVAVFFVLSGFVIAHSLVGRRLDGRGLAEFTLRRSLRLDPPYWAAIAVSIAVGLAIPHARAPLSLGTLAAHLFYLQELVGAPEIDIVFWSLTYEVQFYLVFALALALAELAVRRGAGAQRTRAVLLAILAVPAVIAAATAGEWAPHGLFLNLWHGFFAGVLAYEAGHRRGNPIPLLLFCALLVGSSLRQANVFDLPCAVTAFGLFAAGRSRALAHGLAAAPWQYLGRISYSLYLLHVPCLVVGIAVWRRIAPAGIGGAALGLAALLALCLAAATLFWWAIERPSHALAKRVRLPHAAPAEAVL